MHYNVTITSTEPEGATSSYTVTGCKDLGIAIGEALHGLRDGIPRMSDTLARVVEALEYDLEGHGNEPWPGYQAAVRGLIRNAVRIIDGWGLDDARSQGLPDEDGWGRCRVPTDC